jgi:hypothetical protein
VTHPLFNFIIFLLIIGNTVLLAMGGYPITKHTTHQLHKYNEIFSIAFMVELVLKLIGLGPKNYIKDAFNQFDLFVVICSIVEISMYYAVATHTDEEGG